MRRVLVIANQTVVGKELLERVKHLQQTDPDVQLIVVVPATEPKDQPLNDHGQPIHFDLGRRQANDRLVQAIDAFRRLGMKVDGRIGPPDPMQAAQEAMSYGSYDVIVVTTLPAGLSRWINMDLPRRLERRFKIPVEHVVGQQELGDGETTERRAISVLLIEDQPADVALTTLAFQSIDHPVELSVADNGEDALATLRSDGKRPDLILLDLNMPVLSGHQFLEKLGSEMGVENYNVVIVTTSTSDADRERAHALGAAAYVVKDPDFDAFRDTLASLIAEVADV